MIPPVVVTGMGLITPLGGNVGENWTGILAKKTGISHNPAKGLPNGFQYLGNVSSFNFPETIPPKLETF